MSCNPNHCQQARGVSFQEKILKRQQLLLWFSITVMSLKLLGVYSNFKFAFIEHLENALNKLNKAVNILRKLPTFSTFARPHLDYGDVCKTRHLILIFMEDCSQSNTTLGGCPKKKYIKRWVQNLCNFAVGSENFVFLQNFQK